MKYEWNDKKVLEAIDKYQKNFKGMGPAMAAISLLALGGIEDAFESESEPGGGKWPDLKEATKENREARGHWPGKILQDTGVLAGSMQPRFGKDFAAAGTNIEYAETHQYGDPSRNIQKRAFMGVTDDLKEDILEALLDHLLSR